MKRDLENKVIAGVCAGIAKEKGWDVRLVRLAAFLLIFFTGGGLLAYVVAACVMPTE